MLSKPAALILGLISEKPRNAYEITKLLEYMNIRWWFAVADSTVYVTIKNLEKREFIRGIVEKSGNMPDKTVYSITEKGESELKDTLRSSILQFDYDTNIFTIAAFFIDIFEADEKKQLLEERLNSLHKYMCGIDKQISREWEEEVPLSHAANVKRMKDIVQAEISGTERLLKACLEEGC